MKLSDYAKGFTTATMALGCLLLTGAKSPPTRFDEIDVGRINIREPDGTLRMVISNRAQFPGTPWKGSEVARPDRKDFAGMLFVNDEGSENGGLIQKGFIDASGKAQAGLSLTFDRFRQDQVIQLLHAEQGGRGSSMLAINDETDGTKFDVLQRSQAIDALQKIDPSERERTLRELKDQGKLPNNRVRLGTTGDGAAALSLADAKGRPRLMLIVTAGGVPSVLLFDEDGRVGRKVELQATPDAGERGQEAIPKKP